jgi:uncharacterized protein YbcI
MARNENIQATESNDGNGSARPTPLSLDISRAIVRLLSEYTGRGPTKARTTINGTLVVCLVEDTLTKGERVLVEKGQLEVVLHIRRSYQDAMSQEATAVVEQLTGRRVMAFMSANHAAPDYGAEIFVLDRAPALSS